MARIPLQLVGDSSRFSQELEVTSLLRHGTLKPQGETGTEGVHAPTISLLRETHAATEFTDGTAAAGTLTMTGTLPPGSMIIACTITGVTGFAEDTSAVMTIGDGSDVDRYMTGTPSVFADGAFGPSGQDGRPSGVAFSRIAVQPVITITSDSDITPVIAGAGVATVSIYYIETT